MPLTRLRFSCAWFLSRAAKPPSGRCALFSRRLTHRVRLYVCNWQGPISAPFITPPTVPNSLPSASAAHLATQSLTVLVPVYNDLKRDVRPSIGKQARDGPSDVGAGTENEDRLRHARRVP